MKRNVALLLFDDVEVLDFAGPFGLLGKEAANTIAAYMEYDRR